MRGRVWLSGGSPAQPGQSWESRCSRALPRVTPRSQRHVIQIIPSHIPRVSSAHRNRAAAASLPSALLSSPHRVCRRRQTPRAAPPPSAPLGCGRVFLCQLCCYGNVLRRVSLSGQHRSEGFPSGDQRGRKKTASQCSAASVLRQPLGTGCCCAELLPPETGKIILRPEIPG